jgi:hypothetical protein
MAATTCASRRSRLTLRPPFPHFGKILLDHMGCPSALQRSTLARMTKPDQRRSGDRAASRRNVMIGGFSQPRW